MEEPPKAWPPDATTSIATESKPIVKDLKPSVSTSEAVETARNEDTSKNSNGDEFRDEKPVLDELKTTINGTRSSEESSSDVKMEAEVKTEEPAENHSNIQEGECSDEEEAILATAVEDSDRADALRELRSDPTFATVASFFNQFGALLGVKPFPFEKLETMLLNTEEDGSVNMGLTELQVAMLRKIRYQVRAQTLAGTLLKFCSFHPHLEDECRQLERYGYANLSVSSKLAILNCLCEAQLDKNPKLRESMMNASKACDLRLIPLGIDKNGLAYWYQRDCDLNMHIYSTEQDDQAGRSWTSAVRSEDEFHAFIDRLKKEDLGYVKKEGGKQEKIIDEQGRMIKTLKKGTFLDIYQDEETMKVRKEVLSKDKLARKSRKDPEAAVEPPKPEPKKRVFDEDVDEEEESEKSKEAPVDVDDIPAELLEEDDGRRVLPRRTARSTAIETLHKLSTPKRERKKPTDYAKANVSLQKDESSSESGNDDDDEAEVGEEEFSSDASDSDDEFKPKSEKNKAERKRRVRDPLAKPRKKKAVVEEEDDETDDEVEEVKERKMANEETNCIKCGKSDRWEVLLLCDCCDDAWHTDCLHPPLWYVPDDDWFCPKCTHGKLIERLELIKQDREMDIVKKKATDEKRLKEAERLKRELDYIGLNIKAIKELNEKAGSSSESVSEDSDEENPRNRRSKKKAIKRIAPRARIDYTPVVTITEGRTRRRKAAEIDYSFSEYDKIIKEAVVIEEGDRPQRKPSPSGRPQGGLGRGKDMANIIEAEQKRKNSADESIKEDADEENEEKEEETDNESEKRSSTMKGKPASRRAAQKKKHKRLNALDSDQSEESVSSEYHISEDEDAAEPSESDPEFAPPRRSFGGRTRSDDEFVVSGSEEDSEGSNYRPARPKAKKRRRFSDDDESGSDWSEEERGGRPKKGKNTKSKPKNKRRRYEDESEEEYEEEEEEEVERTSTGRPLRRAVAQASKKKVVISDDEDEEEEKEDEADSDVDQTPVQPKGKKRKIESDEDEFQPEGEEEELEEEDEEEESAEKEEDEDDEEEEESDAERRARKVPDTARRAPPPKSGLNKAATPAERPVNNRPGRTIIAEKCPRNMGTATNSTAVEEKASEEAPTGSEKAEQSTSVAEKPKLLITEERKPVLDTTPINDAPAHHEDIKPIIKARLATTETTTPLQKLETMKPMEQETKPNLGPLPVAHAPLPGRSVMTLPNVYAQGPHPQATQAPSQPPTQAPPPGQPGAPIPRGPLPPHGYPPRHPGHPGFPPGYPYHPGAPMPPQGGPPPHSRAPVWGLYSPYGPPPPQMPPHTRSGLPANPYGGPMPGMYGAPPVSSVAPPNSAPQPTHRGTPPTSLSNPYAQPAVSKGDDNSLGNALASAMDGDY